MDHDQLVRVEREKAFHNDRFMEESRINQEKYYFALARGGNHFWSKVESLAHRADVLEYGCGIGINALRLAGLAKSFHGIDISEVGIEHAKLKAKENDFENAFFNVMNAESLDYPDASFDFIFGVGIIHHLDIMRSMSEIRRVLRPGGKAIFWEPLGHNALINLYRKFTPEARTPDEHPLLKRDFDIIARIFPTINRRHTGALTLCSVPLQNKAYGAKLRDILDSIDQAMFLVPLFRWSSWYVEFELSN